MRRRQTAVSLVASALLAGALGGSLQAAVGTDSSALREAMTVAGMQTHLRALQEIADANGGTRVDNTPGYDQSVEYVALRLDQAGYDVTIQAFEFETFLTSNTVLERIAPAPRAYAEGFDGDFVVSEFSGSGDVTAALTPVDVVVPIGDNPPNTSTSGCEAADFAGFPAGNIALIQRGTCTFATKALNAQTAGASGVILFNEGQPDIPGDDRVGVIGATLGEHGLVSVPVFDTTYANGEELALAPGVVMHMRTTATLETLRSANVIADTAGGRADRTVVVGAHLDSVAEGPGIQDNGSGSALVLELAESIAALDLTPRNRIRFAFWGGEEFGLLGAEHYVATLPGRELRNIAVNLNFDMVASPNFVRFVYDGDGSASGIKGPSGSGNVEKVFTDYFASQGLESEPTDFDGRSDYGPFIAVGIPAGGLFTGAEGIKTAEQAAVYGGTAGIAYDPCYHAACDTYANVNEIALDQNADAAAHATMEFAMTTSAVNGTSKASAKALDEGLASLLYRGNLRQR